MKKRATKNFSFFATLFAAVVVVVVFVGIAALDIIFVCCVVAGPR